MKNKKTGAFKRKPVHVRGNAVSGHVTKQNMREFRIKNFDIGTTHTVAEELIQLHSHIVPEAMTANRSPLTHSG